MILVLIFLYSINVMASNTISETVKETIEYNSEGELTDKTKISVDIDVSKDIDANIAFTVKNLISAEPIGLNLEGELIYLTDDGGKISIGGDIDLITDDSGLFVKYMGLKLGDKGNLDSKAKIEFPAQTWYAISTLAYNLSEDILLLGELRYDSDGVEIFSAEAQLKYAISKNVDITFGAELNDWEDDINDWDSYTIKSGIDKVYTEIVIKF